MIKVGDGQSDKQVPLLTSPRCFNKDISTFDLGTQDRDDFHAYAVVSVMKMAVIKVVFVYCQEHCHNESI